MKNIKNKKTLSAVLMALCFSFMGIFGGCEKQPNVTKETTQNPKSVWECVLEQFDVTITLTMESIDSNTKLVSVEKSPVSDEVNDSYIQFSHKEQYHLTVDTETLQEADTYYVVPVGLFLGPLDGNINNRYQSFYVTELSENTMKLRYMGHLPDFSLYVRYYTFNKIEK
ncbi:MAG: hypothetical protein LBV41_07185 [Cytophagaceae bacterium]|jgi:hypothetical protein|nr:hypothetical protein [Cytophagaceae bacterium]